MTVESEVFSSLKITKKFYFKSVENHYEAVVLFVLRESAVVVFPQKPFHITASL